MAKKIKKSINRKAIIIGVIVVAVFLIGLALLLNPSLTGQAVSCDTGSTILSLHVDGNRNGYVAPINAANIKLSPSDRACIYSTKTNQNGDVNMRVSPGKYRLSIYKTGKCSSHSEDIIVASSGLQTFRLQNCKRMFEI